MYYTVYKITNLINGKYYIGKHQTMNLDDDYMGSGKILKLAINKYGIENFKKEILHIFDTEEEMNAKEKELVVINENTYNLNQGGNGGFSYINTTNKNIYPNHSTITKEVLAQNRAKQKERRKTDIDYYNRFLEHRRRASKKGNIQLFKKYPNGTFFGRKHSQETIEKFKGHTRQVGDKNSQFGTCWVYNEHGNKKIPKTDLDKYLNLGYLKGRKYKNT